MQQELENLKSMSLGDHLEELRFRLIFILIGISVCFVISLGFGKSFVHILQAPYDNAIAQINSSDTAPDNIADTNNAPSQMPLKTIGPGEGFKTYMKVCMFFGILTSSPWVIWQIWAFVSAGLYKKEKQFVHAVAPASAVLFIVGALFFMLFVAPLIMKFFVEFDRMLGADSEWTLLNYINMVLSLTLTFGIAFQSPILIVFAEKIGLVTVEQLQKVRKYVILAIFIISAIATPADVASQILLAIPLYALYESSILACLFLRKNRLRAKN